MIEKIHYYPFFIRLWHFVNAVMFLLLIVTGLSMQYSTPDSPLIRFDLAVKLHDIGGITVSISYLIFFFGNIITDNGQHYKISAKGYLNELRLQARYYAYGVFKGEPQPFPVSTNRKFNPLQKLSYIFVMYFGLPVLIISGLLLYFPDIFDLVGVEKLILADIIHVLAGIVLTMFMLVHVYFCTFGHTLTSNFKSIITGWHDVEP